MFNMEGAESVRVEDRRDHELALQEGPSLDRHIVFRFSQ